MKEDELVHEMVPLAHHREPIIQEVLDALKTVLTREVLENGNEVVLADFGKFYLSASKERDVHDMKTGGTIRLPASCRVRFKAFSKLKKGVNKYLKKGVSKRGH